MFFRFVLPAASLQRNMVHTNVCVLLVSQTSRKALSHKITNPRWRTRASTSSTPKKADPWGVGWGGGGVGRVWGLGFGVWGLGFGV